MMDLEQEILINKYGQNLIPIEVLINDYERLDTTNKRMYLQHLLTLIIQSKSTDLDISKAIENGCLKETFTPCVVLRKGGVKYSTLKRMIDLPEYELEKVLILLLNLFKIGYYRRFLKEKNNPNKWWYWDLSDETKTQSISNNINLI